MNLKTFKNTPKDCQSQITSYAWLTKNDKLRQTREQCLRISENHSSYRPDSVFFFSYTSMETLSMKIPLYKFAFSAIDYPELHAK